MLPPPAPTVCRSSIGTPRARPPISVSRANGMSPSWITPTSKLVPPMSQVIRSATPRARATAAPATTPPAGPESTVSTQRRAADSAVMTPPLDFITYSGAVKPASRSPAPSRVT